MYENGYAEEDSAKVLTKAGLDEWYDKYIIEPGKDDEVNIYNTGVFKTIYQTEYDKYQTLVDNYSYYWLGSAYNSGSMYGVNLHSRNVNDYCYSDYAFGLRLLVFLKSDISLKKRRNSKSI